MEKGYTLLTEKEAMWAQMLMDMLKDNGIFCRSVPVFGAGLSVSAGFQDRWKIYVPDSHFQDAQDFMQAFFPEKDEE